MIQKENEKIMKDKDGTDTLKIKDTSDGNSDV